MQPSEAPPQIRYLSKTFPSSQPLAFHDRNLYFSEVTPLDSNSQVFDLIKMLIAAIREDNARLWQERTEERLTALAYRENIFNSLLPYLPVVMTRLAQEPPRTPVIPTRIIDLLESISPEQLQEIRKILTSAQLVEFTKLLALRENKASV